MPRRPTFAADTPAASLREWIANAISEVFTVNRVLPILRRPPAEPPPPLPLLFEDLPEQRPGDPPVVRPAPEPAPEPAPVLDERDFPNAALMRRIVGDAIAPPSELVIKRRRLKRERAEAASAARDADVATVEPEPVPEPAAPFLTMDMGRFRDAHGIDRCEVGPRGGYVVACPPFHLHDEDHVEPVDEFLGQVAHFRPARALLFRRRDPNFLDGCAVGQRYVLLRFWDDEEGQVWSMPVEGEDYGAVSSALLQTLTLYRRGRRTSA